VLHALNATPALARISIATIAFMKLLGIVGLPIFAISAGTAGEPAQMMWNR
jgi:hypothetical protein